MTTAYILFLRWYSSLTGHYSRCLFFLQKIADITAANTTHRKGIDAQLVTLSHQSDRLKGCFDECVRSIGSCNAAITSQCAASEAASAGAVTAVKRQIKDVEAAIQRQIDALTQAIHALAAVLNVAPTRV